MKAKVLRISNVQVYKFKKKNVLDRISIMKQRKGGGAAAQVKPDPPPGVFNSLFRVSICPL